MAGAEHVVRGLIPAQERSEAVPGADGREAIVPTGQDLVDVGLVTGVPDHLVARRVVGVVKRDAELGDPECRPEMASLLRDHIDMALAHLGDELMQLLTGQGAQVGGTVDALQYGCHPNDSSALSPGSGLAKVSRIGHLAQPEAKAQQPLDHAPQTVGRRSKNQSVASHPAVARRSEPFGTHIEIENGVGVISVAADRTARTTR